jgi:hypothetical protein
MLMRKLLFLFLAFLPLPVFAASLFEDILTILGAFVGSLYDVLLVLSGMILGVGVTSLAIYYAMKFLKWARMVA